MTLSIMKPGRPPSHLASIIAPLFHGACLLWFCSVWWWHTTPAAAYLPGSKGFGWFFRYLTFYTYTLQLIALLLATLDGIWRLARRGLSSPLTAAVDDLSCALFALAHVVTIMFHIIHYTTQSVVEGKERPAWLSLSVHVFNSWVVWADLLLAPQRTFSSRSERLSIVLVVGYISWLFLVKQVFGQFPYPFMNKLPHPQGFLYVVTGGVVVFVAMFRVGRSLNARLQHACHKDGQARQPINLTVEAHAKVQ